MMDFFFGPLVLFPVEKTGKKNTPPLPEGEIVKTKPTRRRKPHTHTHK